nr:hypothetical protein [Tanacetum cinerariifolium]
MQAYTDEKKHVETLPDQYILPRWTLDSRFKVGNHSIRIKEVNDESEVSALTLWCVHSNSTKAIEQAKDCPSDITRQNTYLVKFLEDQMSRKRVKEPENVPEDNYVRVSQVDMMPQICVRDPVDQRFAGKKMTDVVLFWQMLLMGMRPCHVKKAVNAMKPPYVVDVTSKQCSDILSEQRKQYKGKEFYGLIKHFQDKASVDINQYFKIDLNSDGSPRNIFWTDGRSRDAYINFGDVVVFDVTYLTNKFKFPFAPFVGVNHHGQSILFGAALLENEREEMFEWLFEQFLECMFDKYPASIITDHDKSICNAIHKVFPNTRHRYCSWQIKKHQAAGEDEDFKTMNSRAILSSVHPIEAKASKSYLRKIFEKFEKE